MGNANELYTRDIIYDMIYMITVKEVSVYEY